MGLWHTTDHLFLGQKTRPYNNHQIKKKNLQNCRPSCPGWPQNKTGGKWKEGEVPQPCSVNWKIWNMKVTIIPILIGAFGIVSKGLLKGLEDVEVGGRVETIQTTTLLKTVRILRVILETAGDLLSLQLQWKTIS